MGSARTVDIPIPTQLGFTQPRRRLMTDTQPDLFGTEPSPDPDDATFDGDTYDPEQDLGRLRGQVNRVYYAMKDGQWRTAEEISRITGDPTPSIQARVRDLRKAKFGAYFVESRRRDKALWEWRVGAKGEGNPPTPKTTVVVERAELKRLQEVERIATLIYNRQQYQSLTTYEMNNLVVILGTALRGSD